MDSSFGMGNSMSKSINDVFDLDGEQPQNMPEPADKEPELWDAYYPDGTPAGVKLIRGEQIPAEYRHVVVDVFVEHTDGSLLLMQRDLNKPNYPGCWEFGAGGSVLAGEEFEAAAVRELFEETGITGRNMKLMHTIVTYETIYKGFLCITDAEKDSVRLQEGETIAYRWISKDEVSDIMKNGNLASSVRKRWEGYISSRFNVN